MMERGVTYLLTGNKFLVVAAISLRSLREHWDGPVTVFIDPEDPHLCTIRQIASAASASAESFDIHRQHRNTCYANKPRLPMTSPYRHTVQIDADTVVVGDLGELWPTFDGELVLTQFADWVTGPQGGPKSRHVYGRVASWEKADPILAQQAMGAPYPAVNTGVLAYGREHPIVKTGWLAETLKNPNAFMSDELAMQLIYPEYPNVRMLDDRWNFSPIYGTARGRSDTRIVHNHGKKHANREQNRALWWPHFRAAWDEDWGGIRAWCPGGDGRLAEYIKQHPEAMEEEPCQSQ